MKIGNFSDLNLWYAKLNFRINNEKRMATFRKLSSLIDNNFTLMDALERIYQIESFNNTRPNEPFAIAVRSWQIGLEHGATFAGASSGWVPQNETLMLTMGDISKLSVALKNVVMVSEGANKIRSAMMSALSYPLFLFGLTIGLIIMIGMYLVPPLAEAAGSNIVWHGSARLLVIVSDFSIKYWHFICAGFIVAIILVWTSLANFAGRGRIFFDKLPPWSVYKISVSVSWLISLAAMVNAGVSITNAMRMLADNSNNYLKNILNSALHFIMNGDNLGRALHNSNRNFPNTEIIGDLSVYADMRGFDENLSQIANTYLEDSIRKMEKFSNVMNSVGILLVSVIIAGVVFGTFEMQDQITTALAS